MFIRVFQCIFVFFPPLAFETFYLLWKKIYLQCPEPQANDRVENPFVSKCAQVWDWYQLEWTIENGAPGMPQPLGGDLVSTHNPQSPNVVSFWARQVGSELPVKILIPE